MPIYEFECDGCGARFEELVAAGASIACPHCGATGVRRLYSTVSPPSRQPRGPAMRSDESRRREREAARRERLAETRGKRAAGESVGAPSKRATGESVGAPSKRVKR